MKKFYKIFLCLFMCTVVSSLTFFSASAMFQMFRMEEDDDVQVEVKPKIVSQLQTAETMRIQEEEFSARYKTITMLPGTKIDLLRELKVEIFKYLRSLYKQSRNYPEIINDEQIMKLFLRLSSLFHPYESSTSVPHGDYIIRIDSRHGLCGSILCLGANIPNPILAVL